MTRDRTAAKDLKKCMGTTQSRDDGHPRAFPGLGPVLGGNLAPSATDGGLLPFGVERDDEMEWAETGE